MFEWDERKNKANLTKHGIDFDAVWEMDWPNAVQNVDGRHEYGEIRVSALLMRDERLYSCVYTPRDGNRRIISLRKANRKEERIYAQELDN